MPRGRCKVDFCSRFGLWILLSVSGRGFVGKTRNLQLKIRIFVLKLTTATLNWRIGSVDAAWHWCQDTGEAPAVPLCLAGRRERKML